MYVCVGVSKRLGEAVGWWTCDEYGAGHHSRTIEQTGKNPLFICNTVRHFSTEGLYRLYQELIVDGGQQQNHVWQKSILSFLDIRTETN